MASSSSRSAGLSSAANWLSRSSMWSLMRASQVSFLDSLIVGSFRLVVCLGLPARGPFCGVPGRWLVSGGGRWLWLPVSGRGTTTGEPVVEGDEPLRQLLGGFRAVTVEETVHRLPCCPEGLVGVHVGFLPSSGGLDCPIGTVSQRER